MILSYIALAILFVVIVALFYAFIWISDIPYLLARKHNHPNLRAIQVGCWLGLFTCHALWPLLFLWAISKQRPLEVVIDEEKSEPDVLAAVMAQARELSSDDAAALSDEIAQLQARLEKIETSTAGARLA